MNVSQSFLFIFRILFADFEKFAVSCTFDILWLFSTYSFSFMKIIYIIDGSPYCRFSIDSIEERFHLKMSTMSRNFILIFFVILLEKKRGAEV